MCDVFVMTVVCYILAACVYFINFMFCVMYVVFLVTCLPSIYCLCVLKENLDVLVLGFQSWSSSILQLLLRMCE